MVMNSKYEENNDILKNFKIVHGNSLFKDVLINLECIENCLCNEISFSFKL